MNKQTDSKKSQGHREKGRVIQITVSGFKSISQEQSIEIRPLTILAGANSSGKSSMMQPLLLLKQTLEESYDPGALLLYGPNVKFTSVEQLLSRTSKGERSGIFSVGIKVGPDTTLTTCFSRKPEKGLDIQKVSFSSDGTTTDLRLGMTHEEAVSAIPSRIRGFYERISRAGERKWVVVRNRCFLELTLEMKAGETDFPSVRINLGTTIEPHIRRLIHLSGLRGNPERTYPVTAVGSTFPGTFEKYVASVLEQWQRRKNDEGFRELIRKFNRDLEKLGLTWKVMATAVNDTEVELKVGRLPHAVKGGKRDLVSIADVGFGVSQTLPVVVALHAAEPGQLLYLEQPEIHLHPRAQFAMAQALADAAARGVQVIAETHSSLLLLGVQALVAESKLSPETVKLHWFKRRDDGTTEVTSADLDESGSFGDWPEDFAEVALEAESRYLDAAELCQRKDSYAGKGFEAPRH